MLDVSPQGLTRLRDESTSLRRVRSGVAANIIRSLAGSDFRSDWTTEDQATENHTHEILVNLLPSVFYRTPGALFETDMLAADDPRVVAINQGLNRWVRTEGFARILERLAVDYIIDHACGLVTIGAAPGQESDPDADLFPTLSRLSPSRVGVDTLAAHADEYRYVFHQWLADKDDLRDAKDPVTGQPLYAPAAVDALTGPQANDDLWYTGLDPTRGADLQARKQVVVTEFFVRETRKIYCIGGNAAEQYLKDPRTPVGPPQGPYVFGDGQCIPDQPYPLSPLQATMGLIRESKAHEKQAAADAASAKRVHITDGAVSGVAEVLSLGGHGRVYVVPGFTTSMVTTIDMPGAMPATLEYIQQNRERVDRVSGLSDTRKGNITNATAREIDEAAAGQDSRTRITAARFQRMVGEILLRAAWMMWELRGVKFWVSVKGPGGRKKPMRFVGGPVPGMEHIPFAALAPSVTIIPFSMEYVGSPMLQQRVSRAVDGTVKVLQAGRAFPELRTPEVLTMLYDSLNMAGQGDRIVDLEMVEAREQMEKAMLMGAAVPGMEPGAEPGTGQEEGVPADPGGDAEGDPDAALDDMVAAV